jgi:hypothetical protein
LITIGKNDIMEGSIGHWKCPIDNTGNLLLAGSGNRIIPFFATPCLQNNGGFYMPTPLEKVCNTCKVYLPITNFHKDKNTQDGHTRRCKSCVAIYRAKWYEANKEKIALLSVEYSKNNRERISDYQAEYYKNNKERIAIREAEHYKNNKERISEYQAEWYEINKERIAKHYQDNKERIAKYR